DVQLSFTVRNYQNKNNLDARLRKCEAFSFLGDNCDPIFQFAVYTENSNGEKRLIAKREAGPFVNKKFVKEVLQVSVIEAEFPSSVELDLDIQDNDADEDKPIARFRRTIPVMQTGQIEVNLGADVRVEVFMKIQCATDYYGDRCDVYCRPVPQLWTCNHVTGARSCDKPCEHGTCVLTNSSALCVCASGWTGEFCKMPVESSLITSMLLPEMPMDPTTDEETIDHLEYSEDSAEQEFAVSPPEVLQTSQPTGISWEITSPTSKNTQTIRPQTERSETLTNNTEIYASSYTSLLEDEPFAPNMSITKEVSGKLTSKNTLYFTVLITVLVGMTWILLTIFIGIYFYRRRKLTSTSNRCGSTWTNASYDTTPGTLQKPYCFEYPSVPHKYENTMNSPSHSYRTNSTLSSTLTYVPSNSSTRCTLPKVPITDKNDPYDIAPPVATGSKIRFAATTKTVESSPPSYHLLSQTSPTITCLPDKDPYEEMPGDIDDYSIWEQDVPATTPLTSFLSANDTQ
ncbi:hypothetical protein PHET_02971, partial [Paragonimus heterotremus]